MNTEHLIAFNIVLLAAIASPGPALLVAIRTTLSAGKAAGMATGFGLGLVAAFWTMLALLGLEMVFKLFPWLYFAMKTAGAIYLLYIAYKMWVNARLRVVPSAKPARHAFRQGITVNLLNPKSVIFAGSVLVVIFPGGMTFWQNSIVVINHLLVEWLFYTILAFGLSRQSLSRSYLKAKQYIDCGAAVILGLFGARLLFVR